MCYLLKWFIEKQALCVFCGTSTQIAKRGCQFDLQSLLHFGKAWHNDEHSNQELLHTVPALI